MFGDWKSKAKSNLLCWTAHLHVGTKAAFTVWRCQLITLAGQVLGREGAQGAHPPAPGPDSGVWLILPLESKGIAGPFTSATLKFVRRTVWGQSGLREKPLEREEAMLGHGAYHENSGSACQQLLIDRKDGQWGGSSCQGIHFTSSGTGFYTW